MKSFIFIFLILFNTLVKAEDFTCAAATVNIAQTAKDQHNITVTSGDNYVVYTADEGYAFNKVTDNFIVIATFELSRKLSPKTVTKYVVENGIYVTIALEPSNHVVYKKTGDGYTELKLADFYETVLFKDLEKVTIDVDKYENATYLESSEFGTGKMYEFPSSTKRPFKVVSNGKDIVGGKEQVLIDVVIYAKEDDKILRVGYVYKKDERIKEIFYKKSGKSWNRVDVKTAAKTLHAINSSFPLNYESLYDGFSRVTILFSVGTLVLFVLYNF